MYVYTFVSVVACRLCSNYERAVQYQVYTSETFLRA